ncbi:MAG: hypothetical protein AAGM22_28720, partial [Acidobacteriota bacterium]
FTFRMYNSGLSHFSPAPKMRIQGSGLQEQELTCDAGIPNATYCEKEITVTMPPEGAHWITATADPDFEIEEIIEDNNSRTLNYVVDGPATTVSCAGTWTLQGTNGTTYDTSAQGSVENNCSVRFAGNTPTGCWRTSGHNGLKAHWILGDDGCPNRVEVDDPATSNPIDFEFNVSIAP